MTARPLDVAALRRRLRGLSSILDDASTDGEADDAAAAFVLHRPAILAALERAEEVADQGCEFCEAMVGDWGEERDGGREPLAHWWACGRCWNAGAESSSTIIGHLSDLLDRALERIPELEREVRRVKGIARENSRANHELIARLYRAERVEAAAWGMLKFGEHEGLCSNHDDASGTESCVFHDAAFNGRRDALIAALAGAPASGEVKGDG